MKGSGRGKAGGALMIVGAILLIVTMFVPWYTLTASGSGGGVSITERISFYAWNVQSSGDLGSMTRTYSDSHLNNTYTHVVLIVVALIIVSLVLALAAGAMAMMSSSPGRKKGTMGLGVVAMLLAIVAPIYQLVAQPGSIKADGGSSFGPSGSSSPASSFFGSSSSSAFGGTANFTWGPGISWYLAIVTFVLILVALILLMRAEPEPAPMSTPAGSMDSSGGPSSGGSMAP